MLGAVAPLGRSETPALLSGIVECVNEDTASNGHRLGLSHYINANVFNAPPGGLRLYIWFKCLIRGDVTRNLQLAAGIMMLSSNRLKPGLLLYVCFALALRYRIDSILL